MLFRSNSYIFPGFGLGVLAVGARRITDAMFMAAAKALAALSPSRHDRNGRLLPPVSDLRKVAVAVAEAVARQAIADGVAPSCGDARLVEKVREHIWEPVYRNYVPAKR